MYGETERGKARAGGAAASDFRRSSCDRANWASARVWASMRAERRSVRQVAQTPTLLV